MHSGSIYISTGKLWYFGQNGYNWTSQPYASINNAYFLGFGSNDVNSSDSYNRWLGIPLRCLAS